VVEEISWTVFLVLGCVGGPICFLNTLYLRSFSSSFGWLSIRNGAMGNTIDGIYFPDLFMYVIS
jgi:lipoprotein signal peptidase